MTHALPSFQYTGLGTRVVLAKGAAADVGREADALGARRVALLSGRRTAASRLGAQVRSALGERLVLTIDDVPEHSSTTLVEATAERARAAGVDGLVAIGGGSAVDTAKAIAIVLAEGGPIARHANSFTPPDKYVQKVLPNPKLPILSIPTTASAAEVTPSLGVKDPAGNKLLFWDMKLAPRTIILDPVANLDVPASLIATTGMNGFAHCIEGLYSKTRNPISDALALEAVRLLHAGLPAVVRNPEDVDARAQVLVGAHMSGLVIVNARVGIHHGVCHKLGSYGGLSHGVANSVLLPHAMRFNAGVTAPMLARAAEAMGMAGPGMTVDAAAAAAIAGVEELQAATGVPRRLRDTGLDRAKLGPLADLAMGDRSLYFNPRLPTRAEVLELLEAAW